MQTYNPSDGIRRQLYQGTPTYATGITPVPLHGGAYMGYVQNLSGCPYTGEPNRGSCRT